MVTEPSQVAIPTKDELLQLSESDPCPCDSGLQFGSCCWRIRSVNWSHPSRTIGAFLNHSEVFNTDPISMDTLRAELRRFDPKNLTEILGKITVALAREYRSSALDVEFELLNFFLEPTLFKRVRFWILTGARLRVFHRLFVLETLRLLLSEEEDPAIGVRPKPYAHEFGELFLKINDVVEPRYLEVRLKAEDETQQRGTVLATFWRYAFFFHEENLGSAIGRSWVMYTEGLPAVDERLGGKSYPFLKRFEETFEFSVPEVLSLGFAIVSRYLHEPEVLMREPGKFALTPSYYQSLELERMRDLVPRMFRFLGRTWQEHRVLMAKEIAKESGNFLQLFSLYDHPMLSLDGSGYFPVDRDFLCAAVTDGLFWKLAEKIDRKVEFPLMRDTFGHLFEWYVATLLNPYSLRDGKRIIWTDWEGTLPKVKGQRSVDAVVRDGETLFFIEATSSTVSPQTTISCEWEKIEKSLVETWFSPDPRTGRDKLKQVAGAISAFEGDALRLDDLSRADVRKVVPVLLTPRAIPQFPDLRARYRELCLNHGLTSEFADSVVFLDIQDLESMLGAFDGVRGWATAFEQTILQRVGTGSMNDYIVANGLDKKRPTRLQGWIEEASEDYRRMLFPKD